MTTTTTEIHHIAIQKARGHGGYGRALAVVTVEGGTYREAQQKVMTALLAHTDSRGGKTYTWGGLKVGGFGSIHETDTTVALPVKFADLKR